MNWENTNNRFVAFFDIMGFKNLVQTTSHDQVIDLMTQISSTVKRMDDGKFGNKDETIVKTSIFSDSIVITSNTDSVDAAAHVMFESAYLFRKSMELHIPIKGCIAHGKFTANFDKSIFFGQPLIDAYLLQEELALYSIVLHHSFESFMTAKKYGNSQFPDNPRWIRHLTQFKNGRSNHYHLNWLFYLPDNEQKKPENTKKLLFKFYETVSGKTRSYVDNTIDLFERMNKPKANKDDA